MNLQMQIMFFIISYLVIYDFTLKEFSIFSDFRFLRTSELE